LPGVYAQRDTGLTESFDVVTARWCGDELELHNPSAHVAQVRIAVETTTQAARGQLAAGWVAKLPLVTVPCSTRSFHCFFYFRYSRLFVQSADIY